MVKIRFIQQPDLEPLLAAERAFNTFLAADGSEKLNPWTLSAEKVLEVIRSYPDEKKGSYDTRTYVAAVGAKVKGGFSLMLMPDRFEFAFVVCGPGEDFALVLRAMLKRAKDKAFRARRRRTLTLYLRDREEAGLRLFVPVLKGEGFKTQVNEHIFRLRGGRWVHRRLGERRAEVQIEQP